MRPLSSGLVFPEEKFLRTPLSFKMSPYILFFIFTLAEFFNKQPQYVNIIKQKSYNFIKNINLTGPYPSKSRGLKRMAEV